MQATDTFKTTISNHLQGVAEKDPLFAETLKKPEKNINDCVTYILNQVKNSGKNGFADEEIFGMAIHYYDEADIKIGKPINGRVVVNHRIDDAIKKAAATASVTHKKTAAKNQVPTNQPSLF